jgi:hypothetical protein
MTRIRNVGGMIIKTTGGDHNMYSEGNIVQNAAGKITETGEEKGVRFGKPKDPPKKEEEVKYVNGHFYNEDGTFEGKVDVKTNSKCNK